MRSSRLCYVLLAAIVVIHAAAATAATTIDMDDPRRIIGRENDVRIDAVLLHETISPGAAIGLTYQIQNLSEEPVAVANRMMAASYDSDSRTITLSIGAEVPPQDGKMPPLVVIRPGEKKIFRGGAAPALTLAAVRATRSAPRYVQVKVCLLRGVDFVSGVNTGQVLSDAHFDKWFESNDTIFLNTIPVRFSSRAVATTTAERRYAPAF